MWLPSPSPRISYLSIYVFIRYLPSAIQETQVSSLVRQDLLEKGRATCSSILAWRTLWTEEPGRLQSMGSQRVGHDLVT